MPTGEEARADRLPGRAIVSATDAARDYRMNGNRVRALRGVSLSVIEGDFVAVTGPSGSGKSTLLHLLGGVDVPTSGTIVFLDQDLERLSEEERARLRLHEVGLVFQRFHLLPMLTALENVELPMSAAGIGRTERRRKAEALLDHVGLADRLRHRPGELSGGQRQRVAIARALANDPSILLADEPTGELDRATSRGVLELFRDLNRQGTTILVATHDLELAAGAKRQVEVVDGKISA
jgi:putative ABC transport system ATP-binding protein